jgi:hypothetical protein
MIQQVTCASLAVDRCGLQAMIENEQIHDGPRIRDHAIMLFPRASPEGHPSPRPLPTFCYFCDAWIISCITISNLRIRRLSTRTSLLKSFAERQPSQSQDQTASSKSTSPKTDPYDRSETRSVRCPSWLILHLPPSSDVQAPTLSDVCALLQTGLRQLQAMNKIPTAHAAAQSAIDKGD